MKKQKAFPWNVIILGLILLLGVSLRLLGTNPGYPLTHPDEGKIVEPIRQIVMFRNFEPFTYWYGTLLQMVLAFITMIIFLPGYLLLFLAQNFRFWTKLLWPFSQNFLVKLNGSLNAGNYFQYWSRYEIAVLSSLSIILVYILSKQLFKNSKIGLISAFLTALNFRHVLSSTFALADAPAGFFALLSVILSIRLIENKSLKDYLLAGLGLVLAVSVKYYVYTIPVFLVCYFLSNWETPKIGIVEKIKKVVFNKPLIITTVISLLLFVALNPYLIIRHQTALEQINYNLVKFGPQWSRLPNFLNGALVTFPYVYLFKYGIGEIISILILGGLIIGLFKYIRGTILLLFSFIPYLLVLTFSPRPNARLYPPLIPFILILAGIAIYQLSQILPGRKIKLFFLVIFTIIVSIPSFKNSFILTFSNSKIQNTIQASSWLTQNLPDTPMDIASTLGVGFPPAKDIKIIQSDPSTDSLLSMQDLYERDIQWVVIDSDSFQTANGELAMYNNFLVKTFLTNEKLFWEKLENTRASLVANELGAYSQVEFVKPFWQSVDPSYLIAKVPDFWKPRKDKLVVSYKFGSNLDKENFPILSLDENGKCFPEIEINKSVGYNNSYALEISSGACSSLQDRILIGTFPVTENKWYTLSALTKQISNSGVINNKDGFFRLDFYSQDNLRLKTYTSGLSSPTNKWLNLYAAGFSPSGAKYAKVSFQVENCCYAEKYIINNVDIFESSAISPTVLLQYPFYNKPLPMNFIWSLPL